jgi:cold shock CspA family protein/ribosome-associated translation inhibitor RaiA
METPLKVDFRAVRPTKHVRDMIAKHVGELEDRFGRMTAGRVVIKAPSAHHRTGGLYEVTVHLALPGGREVNVGRTACADERHADIDFAVNDAFKRARRRLQDHVQRMQGHVKSHQETPVGKVVRLDPEKGHGFIESEDGREIYFHQNSVLDAKFQQLAPGTRVRFSEEMGDKGPQASTVDPLGKHALR